MSVILYLAIICVEQLTRVGTMRNADTPSISHGNPTRFLAELSLPLLSILRNVASLTIPPAFLAISIYPAQGRCREGNVLTSKESLLAWVVVFLSIGTVDTAKAQTPPRYNIVAQHVELLIREYRIPSFTEEQTGTPGEIRYVWRESWLEFTFTRYNGWISGMSLIEHVPNSAELPMRRVTVKGLVGAVRLNEIGSGYRPECTDLAASTVQCVSSRIEIMYTETAGGEGGYWLLYGVGYRHDGYRRQDDGHD